MTTSTLDNLPLITVIVPIYNVASYLDTCLNSIKQQTYQNLEIILIDDCSTDHSSEVIQAHLCDERIKLLIHECNSGLSAARNTGIAAANGDYLMFVDSDDIIDIHLVQTCLHGALESEADVVLFCVKPFQDGQATQVLPTLEHREYQGRAMTQAEYLTYPHFAWLKFMRTDLVRRQCLQFPVGHYYEDWPFHWETGFVAANIFRVDCGYYHYRQRSASITGAGDQKLLHIFSSQRLVANIVDHYVGSIKAKEILANKIYNGTWFVLTTIKKQYLKEAVTTAKAHLKTTYQHRSYSRPAPKVRLLLLSLKLPTPLALVAIASMRAGVNQWSASRTRIRQRQS